MSNWTQEDLDRRNREVFGISSGASPSENSKPKRTANKWEQEFGARLERWKEEGTLLWYQFEGIRVRLADGAYYKPDFVAMNRVGEMLAFEVKGMWREAARVRIKVAAELFPIRFCAVRKKKVREGGGWEEEWFEARFNRTVGWKA